MIRVFGTITTPSGTPIPNAQIEVRSLTNNANVLVNSVINHRCDANGRYDFSLADGVYDVYAQNDYCSDMDYLGIGMIKPISPDGNLQSILVDGGANNLPPEFNVSVVDIANIEPDINGVVTINILQSSIFVVTLGNAARYTVKLDGVRPSSSKLQSVTIHFRQTTGATELDWPGNIRWNYGSKPKLSLKNDTQDTIFLQTMNGGQHWMGGVMFGGIAWR